MSYLVAICAESSTMHNNAALNHAKLTQYAHIEIQGQDQHMLAARAFMASIDTLRALGS